MPAAGGAARLLVAHSAHESRPLYSPDGRYLAFNSNRNGGQDVYLMDLSTGQVTRLTHESGSEQLTGWSGDGAWVYFTSSAEDISGAQDVFRVRITGGTPMAVAADRYETEYFAAPSPQGGEVAIATRGRMPSGAVVAERARPHRRVGDLGPGRGDDLRWRAHLPARFHRRKEPLAHVGG